MAISSLHAGSESAWGLWAICQTKYLHTLCVTDIMYIKST